MTVPSPNPLPPHLPRAQLDFQLSPSRSAKDAMGVLQRHERTTAALIQGNDIIPGLTVSRDVACGPGARQRMDICTPKGPGTGTTPCLVFVHGGFWQEGSKAGSGFAARQWARAGWAHVGVGYSLTPDVQLSDIVTEIATALVCLRQVAADYNIDPDRIIVAGHSAGAHLVAALMAGIGGDAAVQAIAGAVLISGVYELSPIAASYVNDVVGMKAADVAALSPMRAKPQRDIPALVLIGSDETEAFQWQSDTLYDLWRPYLTRIELDKVSGRDHFDILDELANPASRTFERISKMVR